MSTEQMARAFHEAYERLAPSFGYETRPETRDFDPESPNGRLMIAVCASLSAPERAPAWQQIETAPKDGTTVLIANDSPGSIHAREAYYVPPAQRYENEPQHEGWWRLAGSSEEFIYGRTPTHWMKLPEPPASPLSRGALEKPE